VEGTSLVPAFADQAIGRGALYWEHEGNRAMREGDWKLVSLAGKPWELYDLGKDRVEMKNLAATMPEKVKEMASMWDEWAKRCNVDTTPKK
jgi:arylsulfatase